jgi:hypothetical protein
MLTIRLRYKTGFWGSSKALTAGELRGPRHEMDSPRYDAGKPVSSWMRARFGAATLSGE